MQITRAIVIAATETTQADFAQRMGYNPSANAGCDDCPVEMVSWHEAVAYCNALSAVEGLAACYRCDGQGADALCWPQTDVPTGILDCEGYRLPTEAEWERAARAGVATGYSNGEPTECQGQDPLADDVAWYADNAGGTPHVVGSKLANAWGLFDTSGNVAEWTGDGYEEQDPTPAVDPVGAPFSISIAVRGGSYQSRPEQIRAMSRQQQASEIRSPTLGLRCVRTVP